VKFTAKTSIDVGTIPGVVYGLASTNGGTQVSVTIPQSADDGTVIVWDPASGLISNAFPIDVAYVPPPPPPVPVIATIAPSTVTAFSGGGVTLAGTGFTGATLVQVGATALPSPFGFYVASDTSISFQAPTAATLGAVSVTVTTPGGTSNAVQLTFVETLPPKLLAGTVAVGGTSFNWTFGAGANDLVYLIASTDPTTFVFGTGSFLLNYTILGQVVASPTGTGAFSIVVPHGLAGVVFYSQVAAIDDVTLAASGSNVRATTILF
jgi:ribosomal protein L35AE/L33A